MAFGYKVPAFNVWARVFKVYATGPDPDTDWLYASPEYAKCQYRGDRANNVISEALFPKGTKLRSRSMTPFGRGDIIQIAGWEYVYYTIGVVRDVGVGFPNEYRTVLLQEPFDTTWDNAQGLYTPNANKDLEPPPGYTPIPVFPGVDYWVDPNQPGWPGPAI